MFIFINNNTLINNNLINLNNTLINNNLINLNNTLINDILKILNNSKEYEKTLLNNKNIKQNITNSLKSKIINQISNLYTFYQIYLNFVFYFIFILSFTFLKNHNLSTTSAFCEQLLLRIKNTMFLPLKYNEWSNTLDKLNNHSQFKFIEYFIN